MKSVLIVKLTSLGDIIHSFLAVKEFKRQFPDCRIDWLVEDVYHDLPLWLDEVDRVYCLNRKKLKHFDKVGLSKLYRIRQRNELKRNGYDAIIDLYFSREVNRYLHGVAPIVGLDAIDLGLIKKEPLQKRYYRQLLSPQDVIANLCHEKLEYVWFYRVLMAQFGDYSLSRELDTTLYQVSSKRVPIVKTSYEDYLVFIHSTSGDSKRWPVEYWRKLVEKAKEAGLKVLLPWGNDEEKQRADKIALGFNNCQVLPRYPISTLFALLRDSKGLIGGDTGFTHMASFFDIPVVRIWGATFVGAAVPGPSAVDIISDYPCSPCMNLKSCKVIEQGLYADSPPCYDEITPETVWKSFRKIAAGGAAEKSEVYGGRLQAPHPQNLKQ
ncbi:glycosyltransferase family 9 protein [Thiomicrorhabdus sp.]|uniref:glycosyltransferase family 9 protein n=1 Tax=Thiomicrorhabdus sp. TaxID=2039724 RepID=UPI0029C6A1B3|nr:glycosyltransferase family 9 protein [Thiomicrorhabdus sp.]